MTVEVLALKLPEKVRGTVALFADGEYIILVNADDGPAVWPSTLTHELRHIARGDLESGKDVQQIETEVRNSSVQYDTAAAVAMLERSGRAVLDLDNIL